MSVFDGTDSIITDSLLSTTILNTSYLSASFVGVPPIPYRATYSIRFIVGLIL
jgi:hypothetical protein